MTKPQSVVVYDGLPLSAGSAHGLGRVSSLDAFTAWQHFLATCTEVLTTSAYFTFATIPGLEADEAVRTRIVDAFPPDEHGHRHPVEPSRVQEALDLLVSIEPQRTNAAGVAPAWLWNTAQFVLLRSDGTPWPQQDPTAFDFQTPGGVHLGASRTALILEGKRSMSVSLSLPEATDEELAATIPWLQSHLPFTIASKHWTRWTLTKNGASYRGRKITL